MIVFQIVAVVNSLPLLVASRFRLVFMACDRCTRKTNHCFQKWVNISLFEPKNIFKDIARYSLAYFKAKLWGRSYV